MQLRLVLILSIFRRLGFKITEDLSLAIVHTISTAFVHLPDEAKTS